MPSRIHPTQRDLIRLNRVLPAGRPYCLEPASPAPDAALLGTARSWRGILPFTHLAREGRMTVTIRRRELLAAFGGAAAAWPLAARAQQAAMPVVGFIRPSRAEEAGHLVAAVRQGLREAGFPSDKYAIEARWANGRIELLPKLAAELIDLKVAAIVASVDPA